MKLKNFILPAIIMLFAFNFVSCDKNDSATPWGESLVYMPQASLLNGGLSNDYPVPFNSDWQTKNYQYDSLNGILKVDLGVYRSGLNQLEPFTVDIKANMDSTQIAAGKIAKGYALTSDYFSLPNQVSVGNGQREQNFSLTIDLKKLANANPGATTKRLVLVVEILNPSKYQLNNKLNKTVVVVNTGAFLAPMDLIKGGDMSPGSEQFWQVVPLIENDLGKVEIRNNVMTISNGSATFTRSSTVVYQPFQVEAGITYQFKADLKSTGASICSFEANINYTKPVALQGYVHLGSDEIFAYTDNWDGLGGGGIGKPLSGNFTSVTSWNNLIDASGTFTATTTGTMYLVFKADCYGNLGTITLDNVSIKEK